MALSNLLQINEPATAGDTVITYMEGLRGVGQSAGVIYLGLQVVCVLVVKPYLGVVTVGEAVAGHPVLLVAPAPGEDPGDQGRRTQVQLQPLVLWAWNGFIAGANQTLLVGLHVEM